MVYTYQKWYRKSQKKGGESNGSTEAFAVAR